MIETGDRRIALASDGQVAVITLARPDKLNALDYEMMLALERAAHAIDAESCEGKGGPFLARPLGD